MEFVILKVWNKNGQLIGTVKLSEDSRPSIIKIHNRIYTYDITYGVYIELEIHEIGFWEMIDSTYVVEEQQESPILKNE